MFPPTQNRARSRLLYFFYVTCWTKTSLGLEYCLPGVLGNREKSHLLLGNKGYFEISCKHNQDVLELKEEERILLQGEIQQTSDVLTFTKSTEISANEHEVMRHSSRRRNKRFVEAG